MKTRTRKSKSQSITGRQLLARFLHHSSPDADTRTMAAAMFALTHWQVAGVTAGSQPPSLLMVNAGDAPSDPLDFAADDFATGMGSKEEQPAGHGLLVGASPEIALRRMVQSLRKLRTIGEVTPYNAGDIQIQKRIFAQGKAQCFGSGRTGHYARRWHDTLGWVTDDTDDIILRLDRPEDHAALRRDLSEHPDRLLTPIGYGEEARRVHKTLMLSGSLDSSQWDGTLVNQLLHTGQPVFFLPHLAEAQIEIGDWTGLKADSLNLSTSRMKSPLGIPPQLPDTPWCRHYEALMRARLRELPATYEFAMLCAARELKPLCALLAKHFTRKGSEANDMAAMFQDLYAMTFRGMVIGLASLAWHGLGIDAGCGTDRTFELMQHLHAHGPVSRRDLLLRFQHFTAASRDQALERLAHEGVLELEDKKVSVVPLADFVRGLFARKEFANPKYFCRDEEQRAGQTKTA